MIFALITATDNDLESDNDIDLNDLMNWSTAEFERLNPGHECGFNDDDDDSSSTNTTISWPDHEFVKSTKVVQIGKSKGQTRHCVYNEETH